jgi:hypothetical protein
MNDTIKYEKRDTLYKFLLEEYSFEVKEDNYYPENFGNFSIVLGYKEGNRNASSFLKSIFSTSLDFLIRYSFDRSQLTVDMANKYDVGDKWYSLYFIHDLIYNPDSINVMERQKDNELRLKELNSFLQKDFGKISNLFSKRNYSNTKKIIDEGLKKSFYLKLPSAKPHQKS